MNLLKIFFGTKAPTSKKNSPQKISIKEKDISEYLKDEIDNASFIKQECKDLVLSHLLKKNDLLKNGVKLTTEEKLELKLNPRQKFTKEFVFILNADGLSSEDSKARVTSLYYRAFMKKSRIDNIQKMRSLGVKRIKLSCAGDERDCSWCIAMSGKEMLSDVDVEALIEKNCTCDSHCRCVIQAILQ